MRKISLAVMSIIMVFALAACGGGQQSSQGTDNQKTDSNPPANQSSDQKKEEKPEKKEPVKLRIGSIYNETTTYGKALNKMKEDIEKASKGEISVEIFHGGSLGSEKDHIQALKGGSLEMMETGTAGIGLYVPETAIFELWYNFGNLQQLVKAFDALTPELDKMYKEKGFKLLGAYFDGPRNILSKKKIETLDQLKGLKFRVPGAKLYVNMANALGAKAVSMAFGDVYTGLQTGAIDAMEGTPDSLLQQKFYEQAKYVINDQHVFQPLSIIYNQDAWDKLTDSQQKIIQDAVKASSEYHLSLVEKVNEDAMNTLKSKGLEVVEVKDIEKWKDAVSKANDEFAKSYGKNGEMILDTINKVLK